MPIRCYGSYKFGMSEARVKPILAEIEKTVRLIANVGNSAAMERVRAELGIKFVFLKNITAQEGEYH
ncbi:hypothetical protein AYI68_g5184 [Smittium mucronatum]|uniref:Uncharacterized protein n=1 Tax=Smittium mucronatum TaxID=133383 RepID=A0A1R0GUY0_9FUNG|nr:hypothetical protein AYI68_g5184 [Smittium mucronatum]